LGGRSPERTSRTASNPGPGTYESSSTLSKHGPSMKGKLADTSMNYTKIIPGPGTYNTSKGAGSGVPSFSIGGRVKPLTSPTKDTPGPGQYNPRGAGDSPRFSLGGRSKADKLDENPGPGSYNAQEFGSIGTDKKGTTLHGRIPDAKDKQLVPGPGTYTAPSSFDLSKGPSMKGRFDDKRINYNPGLTIFYHADNIRSRYI
jgi:hypothetical protein